MLVLSTQKITISVFLNLFSLTDFPTALVGDLYAIQGGLTTWTMDFLTCRHQIYVYLSYRLILYLYKL